jgi:hypothetical protein
VKSISKIRSDLLKITNGRFLISNSPPVFGARSISRTKSPNLFDQHGFWNGGLELSKEFELDKRNFDPRDIAGTFSGLDDDVAEKGIEALAWYVSLHNSEDEWGIYIPMTSVHYLVNRLFEKEKISDTRKFNLAFDLLLHHERFHFLADYAQTQTELLLGVACRYMLKNQFPKGKYLEIEEALANAFMLNQLQNSATKKQLEKIKKFVLNQPAGYRDALPYSEDPEYFNHGQSEVVKAYVGLVALDKNVSLPISSIDWQSSFISPEKTDWSECPVFIIQDDERMGLPPLVPKFLPCIPDIRETKKFLKKFSKLPQQYQNSWLETKSDLTVKPPNPKQFEALKGKMRGIYSLRVGSGHRAHLKPINEYEYWEAFEIGTHTEMRHD